MADGGVRGGLIRRQHEFLRAVALGIHIDDFGSHLLQTIETVIHDFDVLPLLVNDHHTGLVEEGFHPLAQFASLGCR